MAAASKELQNGPPFFRFHFPIYFLPCVTNIIPANESVTFHPIQRHRIPNPVHIQTLSKTGRKQISSVLWPHSHHCPFPDHVTSRPQSMEPLVINTTAFFFISYHTDHIVMMLLNQISTLTICISATANQFDLILPFFHVTVKINGHMSHVTSLSLYNARTNTSISSGLLHCQFILHSGYNIFPELSESHENQQY